MVNLYDFYVTDYRGRHRPFRAIALPIFLLADPRDRKLIGRGKEGAKERRGERGILICSAEDKYLGPAAI